MVRQEHVERVDQHLDVRRMQTGDRLVQHHQSGPGRERQRQEHLAPGRRGRGLLHGQVLPQH
ncbi:hypothetical protein K4749_25095 [Streptomyces sp. TRM72054]|uniref:hypothetical protein n=1 Tax=Streptomyces sp. TRM72054 TaxID=2870562 RepID=UPI001C8CA715|nr:hypothetical protein [Streptomyces sp. TRM72054]MBX9396774.1 hypothetical protein [Streptomyces sp. TRM72054]